MVTLILIALLLPLIGGAALPLFRPQDGEGARRLCGGGGAGDLRAGVDDVALRDGARYDLFTLMDELTFSFRLDGMSCVFAGLISLLWPLASLYGFEYMTHEERPNTFFAYYTMTYGVTLANALAGEPVHALCVLRMPDDDHPAACHPQAGRGLHPRRTQVRGLLHRRARRWASSP